MPDESHPCLRRLLSQQKLLCEFNDFDAHMRASKECLPAREGAADSVQIAWLLFDFARDHFFMLRVIGLKLAGFGKGVLWAWDEGNPPVYLTMARAFMEHTASLSYQVAALGRAENDLPRQSDAVRIRNEISKHHGVIQRLYYGKGQERRIHVNDLLRTLAKEYENVEAVYSELCEFVHPNYGSNALVSSGELGQGILQPSSNQYPSEMRLANVAVEKCSEIVFDYQIRASAHLLALDSRVQIASQTGTKPTQIFSKKTGHEGDGRSKENALFFPSARTHFEAMEAAYSFLKKNRLVLTSRPQIAGFENGFMFEIMPTSGGHLWLKYAVKLRIPRS